MTWGDRSMTSRASPTGFLTCFTPATPAPPRAGRPHGDRAGPTPPWTSAPPPGARALPRAGHPRPPGRGGGGDGRGAGVGGPAGPAFSPPAPAAPPPPRRIAAAIREA